MNLVAITEFPAESRKPNALETIQGCQYCHKNYFAFYVVSLKQDNELFLTLPNRYHSSNNW